MSPDCYQVEVIHYINPHLIWVVVRDPSVEKDEFLFEQIGVYGVLPLDKTLDMLTEDLISQKCEDWLPAAAVVMKNVLDRGHEVWFAPIHIERRSSIFDDNIHKYGELVIKTKSGKLKKLSKYLIDSGFAYDNVCEFHEKLSCGKLKTKLSKIRTQEVIKNLENYHTKNYKSNDIWKKSIKRQTSVFQATLYFESALTVSNLEKQNQAINKMLKNKEKDFELCKDVDEVSLARASHRSKTKKELEEAVADESPVISKKLSKTKKNSNNPDTGEEAYNKIVNFLSNNNKNEKLNETHNVQKENSHSKPDNTMQSESILTKKLKYHKIIHSNRENDENEVEKSVADVRKFLENTTVQDFQTEQIENIEEEVQQKPSLSERFGEMARFSNQREDNTRSTDQFQEKSSGTEFKKKRNIFKQFEEKTSRENGKHGQVDLNKTLKRPVKSPKRKISDATIQVAYGPPDMDRKYFSIITKSAYEDQDEEDRKIDDIQEVVYEKHSYKHYGEDSDVEIEITNKNTLIEYNKSCKVDVPDGNSSYNVYSNGLNVTVQQEQKIGQVSNVGYTKHETTDRRQHHKKTHTQHTITQTKTLKHNRFIVKADSDECGVVYDSFVNTDSKSKNNNLLIQNKRKTGNIKHKDDLVKKHESDRNVSNVGYANHETTDRSNVKTDSDKRGVGYGCVANADLMSKNNNFLLRNKRKIENIKRRHDLVNRSDAEVTSTDSVETKQLSLIERKLKHHHNLVKRNSSVSSSDTSNKDSSSDIDKVIEEINLKYGDGDVRKPVEDTKMEFDVLKLQNNVNPFRNIDPSVSIFVEKLVTPVLMVHSKCDSRIQPVFDMRDVYFRSHVHNILRNMCVEHPMILQTVSWPIILRGHSLFMVGPMASGKTVGYLPAVCSLVCDSKNSESLETGGPWCIIVCATAQSVANIERQAKLFLQTDDKVLGCYAGVDNFHVTTTLLNGCDLLVATPSALTRLLQATEFGVDLRRLTTFVLDDFERLSEVYATEVKYFNHKIRGMLKNRANKEQKVQYVVSSRIWCDFMEPLAKNVPDTVICIGAFQECVLYSKANTSVTLVKKKNKLDIVLEFLKSIDASKRTVIVCQSNEEVELLENTLKKSEHVVFSGNNDMTIHDLYNLNVSWADFKVPLIGPVLICCDENLIHMNVTDAHNLIHYSMPKLFSMFSKRFSVLNDNYPSIFKADNENVKIKVLLEETNVEQLPKILNFIKRCNDNVPSVLDEISASVIKQKDVIKAGKYIPLCDTLLTLGYCPDFYNCRERHTILKDYDTPKDWLPQEGTIKCKILYYHSATLYSARLLSCTVNGTTTNYPQGYAKLSLKMGMYYSKESNRKLQGIPKVGDVCATSIKLNFYVRCQVIKILSKYEKGNPNKVLVKLIDEERLDVTRDIYLYHLPDELKEIESRVILVRLANIQPKDKDITFSDLARDRLEQITETNADVFVRGNVCLTLGNCIFVNTLEACEDLTSLSEVVVKYDFKQELLDIHAIPNPEHLPKLEEMCTESGLTEKKELKVTETKIPVKNVPRGSWAFLEKDALSMVFCASAINPDKFFVRLDKFESCMVGLLQDIKMHVDANPGQCGKVKEGEIVLAKFPDDETYERARIDRIKEDTAKCFFVDQGDWKEIPLNHLKPITEKLINQLPFQAIECRLVGIQPMGDQWTDFSTNWFIDKCYKDNGDLKYLFVKYFTKEAAEFTNGHKYSVAIIDTRTEQDVVLNQMMIDFNLAQKKQSEIEYLDGLEIQKPKETTSDTVTDESDDELTCESNTGQVKVEKTVVPSQNNNVLLKAPLRSVPLINSDNESEASDKWDVVMGDSDYGDLFPALQKRKQLKGETPKRAVDGVKSPASKKLDDVKKIEITELDSDDLTSPDNTFVSTEILVPSNNPTKSVFSENRNRVEEKMKSLSDMKNLADQKRRPKIVWHQNKNIVTVKIQLIGADVFELNIQDRVLSFNANVNDTDYGFELELYGTVVKDKCSYANKGQYILVKLKKVLNRNWLTLTRDGGIKKWIVYDIDSLDASSEEETNDDSNVQNIVQDMPVSESEEDDFDDDAHINYSIH